MTTNQKIEDLVKEIQTQIESITKLMASIKEVKEKIPKPKEDEKL